MTTRNIYELAQTWNNGAVDFTAIKMNVTDTASASTSKLLDLQVGGSSIFNVRKNGVITFTPAPWQTVTFAPSGYPTTGWALSVGNWYWLGAGTPRFALHTNHGVQIVNSALGFTTGAGLGSDLFIARDAANTLALRNSTNAQAFNIYNTYTDASNYERGFMRWNANLLEIGMEVAGTGVARDMRFGTGNFHYRAGSSRLELRCGASANHNIAVDGFNQYLGAVQWSGAFDLGRAAYPFRDIYLRPSASLTPSANGDLCIEATNNTTLTFKLKGSDGTVRDGLVPLSDGYPRTQYTKRQSLTDGATINWDASLTQVASVILAGNRTLANPTNLRDGATYILMIQQDATGSRTLAYGDKYLWPDGEAPVLSTAANTITLLTFVSDGTNLYGTSVKTYTPSGPQQIPAPGP